MCACLEKEDYVFGNHRSHGHFLAKGGSLKGMVAEILCKADGVFQGEGRVHASDRPGLRDDGVSAYCGGVSRKNAQKTQEGFSTDFTNFREWVFGRTYGRIADLKDGWLLGLKGGRI